MSCPIFHVGNKPMIQNILDHHKDLLIKSDWPLNAKDFFYKLCFTDVDHEENKELYHLICDLFNSWCLWCDEKIWISGQSSPLSANPYDLDLDDTLGE